MLIRQTYMIGKNLEMVGRSSRPCGRGSAGRLPPAGSSPASQSASGPLPGRRCRLLRQILKRPAHAFGEYLDVRAVVPVSDRGEVELAGVGHDRGAQGHVAGDRQYREHLEQRCPGKVQRGRRSGDIGDEDVQVSLMRQEEVEGPPGEDEPEDPAGYLGAGVLLAL